MKIFVGLGNPGAKYANHRHNVGFMAVDRIAEQNGFGPWKKKFQGLCSEGDLGGERVLLLKPSTYMNESGRAVGEASRFLKVDVSEVIAFHDELDLAPGKIKVKTGGGNAGHNGLRSLTSHIGNDFVRVRIGIGHPGSKDLVHNWVLHDFACAEEAWLQPLLDAIASSAGHLAQADSARFLTDVARAVQQDEDVSGNKASSQKTRKQEEKNTNSRRSAHPAGERMAKQKSALAENLKKWLAGRKTETDGPQS